MQMNRYDQAATLRAKMEKRERVL
nr:Chain E, ATP-binding protein YlxH [Bacillus subtilis]3SYN_F Chain F, ATP-binding protein YlxH [Bacillus subtilis]3SYN_G Chain G, ATP-binding protein YlxH [Bacillus subtilis]3SYN_H Chain H, ATP-binding protein YlxH [Bacillus subtilis]